MPHDVVGNAGQATRRAKAQHDAGVAKSSTLSDLQELGASRTPLGAVAVAVVIPVVPVVAAAVSVLVPVLVALVGTVVVARSRRAGRR